jgi:hypothetical protein
VRIILVSGPPRAGKDTAGQLLCAHAVGPLALDKLAVDLKERCHAAYRLFDGRTRMPLRHDYFEAQKDVMLQCFEGLTPRQAYVKFFQCWVEPVVGAGALGMWMVRRQMALMRYGLEKGMVMPAGLVITDAGRVEDCLPVIRQHGAESCTQLRVERDGCTFEGDSRVDFDLSSRGVRVATVRNPGDTMAGLLNRLREAAPWLFIEIARA